MLIIKLKKYKFFLNKLKKFKFNYFNLFKKLFNKFYYYKKFNIFLNFLIKAYRFGFLKIQLKKLKK
jgi:hypothetical protein